MFSTNKIIPEDNFSDVFMHVYEWEEIVGLIFRNVFINKGENIYFCSACKAFTV